MKSFEEKLDRLEEISRKINEDCPLEEALKLFEEGIGLSRGLEKELSRIERKVEVLVNTPDPGEVSRPPEERTEKPVLDLFPDLED